MGYFIFLSVFIAYIVTALTKQKNCVKLILITSALPFTLLMPSFVVPIGGGVNPQAFLLLLIFFTIAFLNLTNAHGLLMTAKTFPFWTLFVLYSGASIVHGPSFFEGMVFFIKMAVPFMVTAALVNIIRKDEEKYQVEKSILLAGSILVLLGVFNFLTGGVFDSAVGRIKWGGTNVLVAPFMSPANFSFMLIVPALISFSRFLLTKRVLWFLLYVAFSASVFLAFTRISMAGLVLGSIVVFGLMKRSYVITFSTPFVSGIIVILSILYIPAVQKRMFFEGAKIDFSASNMQKLIDSVNTSGRTSLWQAAIDYFESTSQWYGAGAGSVDYWLAAHSKAAALHSEFLRLYLDLGILGLVCFILAVLELFFKPLLKLGIKNVPMNILRNIAVFIGIFSAYFMTLLTDNTLNYVTEFSVYSFSMMALIYVGSDPINNGSQTC